MRIALLLIFTSVLSCSAASGVRYVTVTATNQNEEAGIEVAPGETGELISIMSKEQTMSSASLEKDGYRVLVYPAPSLSGVGSTVAGPATFKLSANGPAYPRMMTVKLMPQTYDVNKTIMLAPGTNKVCVSLESSTNLVHWGDATNGLYGSTNEARFFRIKLEKPTQE